MANDSHTITIWQVNKDRLAWMQQRIAGTPRILSLSAGKSTCSIFKAPQNFVNINDRSYYYQPHIVSVGPYHHGDPRLSIIEEHKWRFLGALLKRRQIDLEDLLRAVQPLEARARECYSTGIHFSADEFVEILVVDGCFVIELLRKFCGIIAFEADDPLLTLSWIFPLLIIDLICLENQIPFFVLQCLFDLTELPGGEESCPSLPILALRFFNNAMQRSDESVEKFRDLAGKHLLDLLRSSFIPACCEEPRERKFTNTKVIHCISKLRFAGVRLKAAAGEESFLVVRFGRGTIEMPMIAMDEIMCSFLVNSVTYEQCHRACSKHMTAYATLLGFLIDTTKDVEYLCDQSIVENYLGTHAELASFIKNLGKGVTFDIDLCYLTELFHQVNAYYLYDWHVQWSFVKNAYFITRWSVISSVAAFLLLLLTVAQAYFTIVSYTSPPN